MFFNKKKPVVSGIETITKMFEQGRLLRNLEPKELIQLWQAGDIPISIEVIIRAEIVRRLQGWMPG